MKHIFFFIVLLLVLDARAQVTSGFFGNHLGGPTEQNIDGRGQKAVWPTSKPGIVRLWDTWGQNPTQGKVTHLFWRDINIANDTYDWTVFDKVLDTCKNRGVDVLYTFGYVPSWANGGNNQGTPPTDTAYFGKFVRAIANRAIQRGWPIKYWEIWNEPEEGSYFWNGTWAQLANMGRCAYQTLKAIDPSYTVLTPPTQGRGAAYWMEFYLKAGGWQWCDAVSYHGYINFYIDNLGERFEGLIDRMNALKTQYNIASKPLWDTEGVDMFTCGSTTCYDLPGQAAYLAQRFLISAAKGVKRVFWYGWDMFYGKQWGNETGTFKANEIGIANEKVVEWMLGATVTNLVVSNGVYSVDITKNGVTNKAVWVNAGTASYTTTYTQYETLAGSTGTVNGSITIGRKPTLLKGAPALASLVSTTSYRINAGGGALSTSLGSFAADNFFAPAPGNTYSTSAAIGGTSNTALYQTERFGSNFGYSLPITNGQYSVKLHFAEIYYTTAGSRVFDVSLESQKVLDNFDIVARAGAFTANSQSFTVSVTDGVLNINFSSLAYDGGKDHAKVSAIEVVPAGTTSYRINAGGGALSTSLGSFAADNFFAPAPGNTYSTSAAIGGTSNTALYQTERFGSNFGYSLPITNGQYSVKLHFAEIYYTTAGSRVFDVSLESQKVLDNFDIVARAGAFTANSQSFTVSVTDGVLNINFSSLAYDGGKDHAKVSAIEVVPAATAGATSSQTASNSAALMRSAGTIVSEPTVATSLAAETYPNPSRGQFNLRILGNSEDAITMRIFDLSGKMMESKTGISANSSLQFGGNLVPGVYIVEIIQGKQRVQKKITKL